MDISFIVIEEDNGVKINNYSSLAKAVICQAVYDMRDAETKLKIDPQDKKALMMLDEVGEFFDSEWFKTLSMGDSGCIRSFLSSEGTN